MPYRKFSSVIEGNHAVDILSNKLRVLTQQRALQHLVNI